ncbi:MAG: IMP dehydrogenase [Zetaproteobacteria bacterium]|nr:IMP dehydrogenase [Zetaproteobacteria bacterium]
MRDPSSPLTISDALAYDDILIIPRHSEVLPTQANVTSHFTRNLKLQIPLVSAAMDTVTESQLAMSLARIGGVGVIHKNQTIERQVEEIRKVKRSESVMITDPICIAPEDPVGDAIQMMQTEGISGLPVLDAGRLVGIITGRDIRFEKRSDIPVKKLMTQEVITAKEGTSIEDAIEILHRHRIEKLPVISRTGQQLVGMFTIRDIENAHRYPHSNKTSRGQLVTAAAVGASGDFMQRTEALLSGGADAIIVDTAHGHSQGVLNAITHIRKSFSQYDFELIGGNIATAQATRALIEAGVDAVKVGIGPGSICTTRVIAGIGVPQFTAVLNCARAAAPFSIPVIADGGIKYSGDIVKALAAGASSVMVGSLLAGTDEAPGEMVIYQGKSYKTYRGMGSIGAMSSGSRDRYFQAEVSDPGKLVPEGIEGRVPYKGPLHRTVDQIVGGIRAAMGYIGAQDIPTLQEVAEFVRISGAGLKESHAHDVFITREAPNYRM